MSERDIEAVADGIGDAVNSDVRDAAFAALDRLASALAEAEREQAIDEQQYADLLADYTNLNRERDILRDALREVRGVALNPAKPRNALDAIIHKADAALARGGRTDE